MQVTQAIEPLDGEASTVRSHSNTRGAVLLMMRDVFQVVPGFSFVKALVLNLPSALGHSEQGACADLLAGEVRQPIGLNHLACGFDRKRQGQEQG
ncbi:MAG: hypothetical protein DMG97_41220 [Acidobacteria bacterium]|nr:MAG: hypothetical protein DMG97_41220 [Acidobacteriota bacterium]PYV72857.1 MAG: hypothetical protein DMG96_24865 [Acidobacteriota bacterium]